MAIKYVQANTLYLAGSGTTIGATTATLTSLTDIYGNVLTMTDFGTTGFITFEPETNNEEAATFTGITANANGTYTLTGVKTGLAKSPYTETSGLVRQHAGGTKVVVTDNVEFWNTFANKNNDETITGNWTFSTFPVTPDVQNASTTVKGVSKLSTAPVSAIDPIAVGDNDSRVNYTISQGVLSTTNKLVTTDNVYTADYDQSQTTQDGTVEVGEANATTKKYKIAQSFVPTKTKIRGATLYKSADTGTFTGTVTFDLMADSSGSPSGTSLATVTLSNAQWTAISTGAFNVTFTTEYASQVAGNLYWITVTTSTGDNSNHINLGTNTAGGYASGSVKYYNATDTWTTIATIDLYFKTLQGVVGQIPGVFGKVQTEVFTESGTYTKPINATIVEIICIGAGGSGGGGKTDASSGMGGQGGGGASIVRKILTASAVGATETITVATSPVGGAAGLEGTAGGSSSFGTLCIAYGGGPGGGGATPKTPGSGAGTGGAGTNNTTSVLGGLPALTVGLDGIAGQGAGALTPTTTPPVSKCAEYGGGSGGQASTNGSENSTDGGSSLFGGSGGGGGGSWGGGTTLRTPGNGGKLGIFTPGGGGAKGSASDGSAGTSRSGTGLCGDGGGGGASVNGGVGFKGGAGGIPGGGGGGGGCSSTGGAGGAGGRGEVIVITYF